MVSIADSAGNRRLDDLTDFVRLEIATAIRRGVRVFPVLVDRASIPASNLLPDDIRPLAGRQAIELTSERWKYDTRGRPGPTSLAHLTRPKGGTAIGASRRIMSRDQSSRIAFTSRVPRMNVPETVYPIPCRRPPHLNVSTDPDQGTRLDDGEGQSASSRRIGSPPWSPDSGTSRIDSHRHPISTASGQLLRASKPNSAPRARRGST